MRLPYLRSLRAASLVVTLGLLSGFASDAFSANYYVRTIGDDGNNGRLPKKAFKTIDRAREAMKAGDTVYVGAGTYYEQVTPRKSGRKGKPIQYVADVDGKYTGDRGPVVLRPNKNWAVHMDGASHTYFNGFIFGKNPNTRSYGVYANRSPHIRFVNCTFRDTIYGVYALNSPFSFQGCSVLDIISYGIYNRYADVAVANSTFQRCKRYALRSDGGNQSQQLVLKDSKFLENHTGPYALNCDLVIDNCQISKQTQWAIRCFSGDLTFTDPNPAINDNGYGIYLSGNPSKEGRVLNGWDVSRNGNYGIYAQDCNLVLNDCKIQEMNGWGMALINSSVTANNSPISNNGDGVYVTSDSRSSIPSKLTNLVVTNNNNRGIYHRSQRTYPSELVMNDCRVDDNGGYCLLSYYGRVELTNTAFRGNYRGMYLYMHPSQSTTSGVGLKAHELTNVQVEDVEAWHGVYAPYHDLTLRDCTISDVQNYGVLNYYANTLAERCTFQRCGRGYAIYNTSKPQFDAGTPTRMVLRQCTFTDNNAGPKADYCNLLLDDCTIASNKSWGLSCAYGELELKNQTKSITGNGSGLYIAGNTNDNRRVLRGWDFSDNDIYGVYGEHCNLVLEDCKVEGMKNWGAAIHYGTLETIRSPIQNNKHGLYVRSDNQFGQPTLTNVVVRNNDGYGLYHHSNWQRPTTLTLSKCQVDGNKTWSLLSNYSSLDANNCVFANNGYGVYLKGHPQSAETPSYHLNDVDIRDIRSWHGVYATYGDLVVENSRFRRISNYGIMNYYGNTDATSCSFDEVGSRSGYALYSSSHPHRGGLKTLSVKDSTIIRGYGGPYAVKSDLIIDNCKIEDNRFWGAVVEGGEIEFRNQVPGIRNNGYGLSVSGNGEDGARVFDGYDISNNTNYGLYATSCNVSLKNARIAGNGWGVGMIYNCSVDAEGSEFTGNTNGIYCLGHPTLGYTQKLRNLKARAMRGYGLYGSRVDLDVANCEIETQGSIGMYKVNNSLVMKDTTISGMGQASYALYARKNTQVDLERVRLGKTKSWAAMIYGGDLRMKNSIVSDSHSGMYLYSWSGEDDVKRIWNVTLANNRYYGLYQIRGKSSIKNTIIASNNPEGSYYGFYLSGGQSDHSHNLFDGFRQAVSGTSLGPGEILGYARFEDPANGNYQLTGPSMAINRGTEMPGRVDFDIAGYQRPAFDLWEMGAYEYTKKQNLVHIVKWQEQR